MAQGYTSGTPISTDVNLSPGSNLLVPSQLAVKTYVDTNNPTAATGKVLQGAGVGVLPVFSTATYPSIATGTGKILIADGTNWVASTPTYPNASATSGKIIISDGTNWIASTPTYPNTSGTAGKVVISDGTNNVYSTPTFPNASAASGKFIRSDGTNWIASTPTLPTSAGTSGKILYSDATNYVESTPTFPTTASATSRKIIVSDGTNWVASTETYATPGSSGNVLTSDGTNWTSAAAPTGNLLIATITLTSAQIKALHATPKQIIAAPGAGKGISVLYMSAKLNYGGTNAFTAGAGQQIGIYYNNNTTAIQVGTFIPNAMITSTANKFSSVVNQLGITTNQAAGILDNVNVAAFQDGSATEISGNAANNNTIDIQVGYYIVTF